jgi:hypothetical protein
MSILKSVEARKPMPPGESVTHWIHQLKGGDAVAAQKL